MDIYESFQIENHVLGRVIKGFFIWFFLAYFFPLECTSVGLNCIDSVHLLLCNNFDSFPFFVLLKYGCVGMMWTCLPWYCCPSHPHLLIWPLQPSVEVGVSHVVQTIPGGAFRIFFFSLSRFHLMCFQRPRGQKDAITLHTIGQSTKTSLSCGSFRCLLQ